VDLMQRIVVATMTVAVLVTLLVLPASVASARAHTPVLPSARAMPAALRIGPLAPDFPLQIALVLHGQHQAALGSLLAAEDDPMSPLYHHYLSPDGFARMYGPAAADVTRVAQVLRAAGMLVELSHAPGSLLMARGPAAAVEALFGVALDEYRAPDGQQYYTGRSSPHLPAALAASVSGVLGLDSRSHLQLRPQIRPLVALRSAQRGAYDGLEPTDLARAYDLGPLQAKGLDGTNQTIAVAEIDAFSAADIATYDKAFGISAPPVRVISVGGGATGHDPEATLDIEVLHAIAPHAHILAYEGGQDLSQLAQVFSQMVSDHRAQVISISLGACEGQTNGSDGQSFVNSLNNTFQQADAEGISVLVASGDSGAYGCQDNALSVELPAASPYVTAVGGTTLYLNSDGTYGHEAGWVGPLEETGSGGGLSQLYSRPSWQTGAGVRNYASNGMRQVPDVAADADPLSGYLIFSSGWQIMGGTSAAAPLWAGLIALADQSAAGNGKSLLGFLNPALYTLGNSDSSPSPFHDVTIGGNLYYQAMPGWDYATGWGSPDAGVLVSALVGQS
jgi:kumamolisin